MRGKQPVATRNIAIYEFTYPEKVSYELSSQCVMVNRRLVNIGVRLIKKSCEAY
jgi:hypothetical protein